MLRNESTGEVAFLSVAWSGNWYADFWMDPSLDRDGLPARGANLAFRAGPHAPGPMRVLDAGETIRFTFRANDNKGPALELAADRSASKDNPLALHNQWMAHWANELEFAFEK
jgi:hypothetical protein